MEQRKINHRLYDIEQCIYSMFYRKIVTITIVIVRDFSKVIGHTVF